MLLTCSLLLVNGCTFDDTPLSDPGGIPTATSGLDLVPYSTITSTLVSDPGAVTQTSAPNPTNIPVPTVTPIIYQVVANDTLTRIALQHSVSLEDLIAANPGIDPNFLTIGLTLTIPSGGIIAASSPTSTPIPISVQSPVCYQMGDNNLQCFSVVENDQAYAVENVIVEISLQSLEGDDSITQAALLPLNVIPEGKKAAVAASFSPPLFLDYVAYANLLSVIPVSPDDQRYLKTEHNIQEVEISTDGQQAKITGWIELPTEPSNIELSVVPKVWVSAFAYDEQKNIVGIRKWIANDILLSNNKINFEFFVYSFGPAIEHVDVLTEVRP